MASLPKTVLVLGATGKQGGATAHHLLAKGWQVRALTRDCTSPAAQALRQAGAEVVQGSTEDRASLEPLMRGIYGVFSVQPAIAGYESEVRQGKNVADAARSASIQHFVYTSMQSAEGLARADSHAISKWEIEQYLRGLGLPTTILRPALFMDDVIGPIFGAPQGTFAIALKPHVPMRLIAVDDIGAFAALAFEHPDVWLGKTIEIAGDMLTPLQIAATLSRATGHAITSVQIPIEVLRQQNESVARVFDFLNTAVYETDIPTLRRMHPDLMDFETWLKKEGKAKFNVAVKPVTEE